MPLIHIRAKGEVGIKPSSNYFYRPFQGGASFLLFMFHVCLYYAVLSFPCSIVIICWERADLLVFFFVMFSCVLSLSLMVSRVRCGT